MFVPLLLLFVTVPFIELYVLIQMGTCLGILPTFGIVVITGIVGAALAKHQGLRVWHHIQAKLS